MIPFDSTYGPMFRPSDRLVAADLTEWQAIPLLALARHFRRVHRIWGVADGLRVEAKEAGGEWTITVEPGTAYDRYGRALSLPGPTTKSAPASERPQLLILRGEAPRAGTAGLALLTPQSCDVEIVDMSSSTGQEVDLCDWEIPLARLEWNAGGGRAANLTLDHTCRPIVASTFRRPFLAVGTLPAGTTAASLADGSGLQVWVDTTSGGFLKRPSTEDAGAPIYLVKIGRPTPEDTLLFLTGQVSVMQSGQADPAQTAPLAPPMVVVSEPSHEGFLLTVRYANDAKAFAGVQATLLDVFWIGVESHQRSFHDHATSAEKEVDMASQLLEPHKISWPEFRDGMPLTADVLNRAKDAIRAYQWLHNQMLHDWGVVEGCAVSPLANLRKVRIEPGFALDDQGRELMIDDPVQLEIPPHVLEPGQGPSKEWWVTVSYAEETLPRGDDPSCRCEGEPLRTKPKALVRWRDPQASTDKDRLVPGKDVILATVAVQQGQVATVSSRGRRSAVPSERPRIAGGRQKIRLSENAVAWPAQSPIGYRVSVDTSAAHFVGLPHYFVTVEAPAESARSAAMTATPMILASADKPGNLGFDVVLPSTALQGSRAADWIGGFLQLLCWVLALALLIGLVVWLPRRWNPDFAAWRGLVSSVLGGIAALTAGGIGMPATVKQSPLMRTGLGTVFAALAMLPAILSDQTWESIWSNIPSGATSGAASGVAGAIPVALWRYWPQLSQGVKKVIASLRPAPNRRADDGDSTPDGVVLTIAWIGIEM